MIFSIIVRKKYLYGAFKIIFSPDTFSTPLRHTGDNLERRFRCQLGGRGLSVIAYTLYSRYGLSYVYHIAYIDLKLSSCLVYECVFRYQLQDQSVSHT